MMKYPKIQTLWKRDLAGNRAVIEGEYACDEFANIKQWLVTEKIDGMNIRIFYMKGAQVSFLGRNDETMLPPKLLNYLRETFSKEIMETYFNEAEEVFLFGEGYGNKIQSGGHYNENQRFVLFDVCLKDVDGKWWWFEYNNIVEVAGGLNVPFAPVLFFGEQLCKKEIVEYVKSKPESTLSRHHNVVTEGVVARAYPMVLFRDGTPVMFKLKCKDFK